MTTGLSEQGPQTAKRGRGHPRGSKFADRDAEIERLYLEDGLTLEEIGRKFQLTRERVRQLLKRRGADNPAQSSGVRRDRKANAAAVADEQFDASTRGRLVSLLLRAEVPILEIVARLSQLGHVVDEPTVTAYARRHRLPIPRPGEARFPPSILRLAVLAAATDASGEIAMDDQAIWIESEALHQLAAVSSGPAEVSALAARASAARRAPEPGTITKAAYEMWRDTWLARFPKSDSLPWPPTAQTVMKRLGGGYWSDALRDVGLLPSERGRSRGALVFTEENEYETAMSEFLTTSASEDRPVSMAEYDRWAVGRVVPSAAAVRTHFGGWNAAKLAGATFSGAPAEGRRRRVQPGDELVDRFRAQLRREFSEAALSLEADVHRKARDMKTKDVADELLAGSVTAFEEFRRRWLYAAIKEDTSKFLERLSPDGQATNSEKRLWSAVTNLEPRDAVEFVITGTSLDGLLSSTDGDLRASGSWLAPAQQARLDRIPLGDSPLWRVLKGSRNLRVHRSDRATRALAAAWRDLDLEGEHSWAGRSAPSTPPNVLRWLVAEVTRGSVFGETRLARSRLAVLLEMLDRTAVLMRSQPAE